MFIKPGMAWPHLSDLKKEHNTNQNSSSEDEQEKSYDSSKREKARAFFAAKQIRSSAYK